MLTTISQPTSYKFTDERLSKRFVNIIGQLSCSLESSIPDATKSKKAKKGAYRFFRNKNVDLTTIFSEHRQNLEPLLLNTLAQSTKSEGTNRFLYLSDTVELNYSNKRTAEDLGPLNSEKSRGLYIHNGLLVSDLGVPIGLANQQYLIRTDEDFKNSAARKYHPIETKESYKWYVDFEAAQQLASQQKNNQPTTTSSINKNTEIVFVADREGDINEIFQARTAPNVHQLIRCQHNRTILWGKNGKTINVKNRLANEQVAQYDTLEVVHPQTKKNRQAQVAIKFCSVVVKLRKGYGAKYYKKHNITPPKRNYRPTIRLQVVQIKEIHPPKDILEPIEWILFTTLPVKNIEQAKQVIQYYKTRWVIERFHYLLKSGGANVEELNFKKNHQLKNALVAYSLAAMDVLRIKYMAENQPDIPITQIGISIKTYQALFTYAHYYVDENILYEVHRIPSVKEFCIVLGRINGFHPTKNRPLPGLKTLARAWTKLDIIIKIFNLSFQ